MPGNEKKLFEPQKIIPNNNSDSLLDNKKTDSSSKALSEIMNLLDPKTLELLQQRLHHNANYGHLFKKLDNNLLDKSIPLVKKITKTQEKALALIDAVEFSKLNVVFAKEFKAQLRDRVLKPYLINQTQYSTCGVVVFVTCLAERYPQLYVQMVISLIEEGFVKFPVEVKLRQTSDKRPIELRSVDEILLTSIRESSNVIFPLQTNRFSAIAGTTPNEIVQWFEGLCPGAKIINNTRVLQTNGETLNLLQKFFVPHQNQDPEIKNLKYNLMLAKAALDNKQWVVLQLLGSTTELLIGRTPSRDEEFFGVEITHFLIVKELELLNASNEIKITIYTWGEEHTAQLPMEAFLKGYRGSINIQLPEELVFSQEECPRVSNPNW